MTMGVIKRKFYDIFDTQEVEDLKIFHMQRVIDIRHDPIGTLQQMVDLMMRNESEYIDKISKRRAQVAVLENLKRTLGKDTGYVHNVSDQKVKGKSVKGGEEKAKRTFKRDWNPASSQYKAFFADKTCFICGKTGHGKQHCPLKNSKAKVHTMSSEAPEEIDNSSVTPRANKNKRARTDERSFTPSIIAKATAVRSSCEDAHYNEFSDSGESSSQ
jgi:hypothetical protein